MKIFDSRGFVFRSPVKAEGHLNLIRRVLVGQLSVVSHANFGCLTRAITSLAKCSDKRDHQNKTRGPEEK